MEVENYQEKMRVNFQVFQECAHPSVFNYLVVLVLVFWINQMNISMGMEGSL